MCSCFRTFLVDDLGKAFPHDAYFYWVSICLPSSVAVSFIHHIGCILCR